MLTGRGIYERLSFDASLRTNKLLLGIGLKFVDDEQVYYPNTSLSLKSKMMPDGEKVLRIYTIDKKKQKHFFKEKAS